MGNCDIGEGNIDFSEAAGSIVEFLEITNSDKLVVFYDQRSARKKIAEEVSSAALIRGVKCLLIDLDTYFPPDDDSDTNTEQGLELLGERLKEFHPNKSYLASDCRVRAKVLKYLLGCVPYTESITGLATIHAHDPDITYQQFQDRPRIDPEQIDGYADRVCEIMGDGEFFVRSSLGTNLTVRLDIDSYPLIRATNRITAMAESFYGEEVINGFWTNPEPGEVFTFPPFVEGTAVFIFIPEYWGDNFREYADLGRRVKVSFEIAPYQNEEYSYIKSVVIEACEDANDDDKIDDDKIMQLQLAMSKWLGIGASPPNARSIIGEIGIGLIPDRKLTGNTLFDEKAGGTFHLAVGGEPDSKATARRLRYGIFPYESPSDAVHLDIVMDGWVDRKD